MAKDVEYFFIYLLAIYASSFSELQKSVFIIDSDACKSLRTTGVMVIAMGFVIRWICALVWKLNVPQRSMC
jgi:hypothetical protein